MEFRGPLALIGCGKMGGALLAGWLDRGLEPSKLSIVEPNAEAAAAFAARGAAAFDAGDALDANQAVVVFAVKPQQMDALVPAYARFAGRGAVFLSIAAGRSLAYFQDRLGAGAAIARAMPNTPAAVGRGMTVLVANPHVGPEQKKTCEELMSAVGEVAWVEDETLLDPVTAVSGGGPAYVFLLIECLAEAGRKAGLSEALAMQLARTTVAGSGELVRQSSDAADTLRRNVTSPGGTTLEALKVLMADDGLQRLMDRAIAEATRRSRELAS